MRHAVRHDQNHVAFCTLTRDRAVRAALLAQPGAYEATYTDVAGAPVAWEVYVPGQLTAEADRLLAIMREVE